MASKLKLNHFIIFAILVSALLHAVPFSYLVFSPAPAVTKNSIEVDLTEVPATSKKSRALIATAPANKKAKTPSARTMKNILGGGFRQQFTSPASDITVGTNDANDRDAEVFPADPMTNVHDYAHGWSGAVQYGNSMGLKFTLESLAFFEALHARIDQRLIYPDDFSRQRITGSVRIEAEIGRDGRLIRFVSTTADDRLLQTYCFSILVQLLSTPLPERSWLSTEKTIVAFDFGFFTRVRNNIPRTLSKAIEKNRLAFQRESEIDPWLNEQLNEIFTRYIPPIIPIPGGVYIDMVMAYQYVNNLMNGQKSERELRGERLTKLHQMLRMALRQAGVAPGPPPPPDPNPQPGPRFIKATSDDSS